MKRRDFLKNSVAATVLPAFINGFSIKAFGNSPLLNAMRNAADNDHVLVMIQLVGGNDGLNMVVPLDQYAGYVAARSNIAIPEGKVLKLNNNTKTGLHPSMTGLQQLYNEEKACVVQSVGYPDPNYSHFRATDIWVSGSDADVIETTGWSGRYLDYKYPNYPVNYPSDEMPDPLAIQIGSIVSPAFQGPSTNMGIAISTATDFYNLVAGVQDPVPDTYAGKELKYIRLIASQADHFSTVIKKAALAAPTQGDYPDNGLAAQLKIVARLVAGGLKTKMYMVSIGGFDTHASQTEGDTTTGQHAKLLGDISSAVKAFMDDLKKMNISHRVAGMTFSEFGRRIKSNGSMGTDHGAAAPMIIFGDYVNQGVLGHTPPMPSTATVSDNIPMQYDFRSVYASLLEQWFCVPDTDIQKLLFRDYQSLPLISGVACGTITGIPQVNAEGEHMITNYPNPFTEKTTLTYKTKGGYTLIQVFDTMGRLVAVPVQGNQPAGQYSATFDGSHLANGIYYARLQNGPVQEVKPMLKVKG
ncbi:Por secretion system C-terminal sorting domain-containing protein [Chitinophaga costaii]|uniref:Por secretion system C-terminal sorting domain-containing protein n=1 Tax=Chitinophaga costaii TaxID=1335309 RepID=A0A1C4BM70_9BACT|nr:DUF1501 domain-containing protein [Chitinophaga costaii]PUZ27557.1 DUF1501 domain-containing protein [Chitinophaga costaii]SCC07782.1 Por secretion system C-terminal sorting domain-containing protein [Chitinophaga costaii]